MMWRLKERCSVQYVFIFGARMETSLTRYLLFIANLCCDETNIEIFLCAGIGENQNSGRVFLRGLSLFASSA